jgi:hypothetical protein
MKMKIPVIILLIHLACIPSAVIEIPLYIGNIKRINVVIPINENKLSRA